MNSFNVKELNFSIVNSTQYSRETALDADAPLSFIDFIKYLQTEYSPEKYSSLYSQYLKLWYNLETESTEEQLELFKDFYKQFIQEIILKYTTETERRFLSQINYDDPNDLDIAIPFYANKLTEVAVFYKDKREEGKYVIDKNKIRGSVTGIEKAIFDNIYNYIINSEDVLLTYSDSISSITKDFGISLHEYVDVYGDYFDIVRDDSDEEGLRKTLFDNNTLDIDPDYYFDPEALKVLRANSFVTPINNFSINPPALTRDDIVSVCNPGESFLEELNNTFTKGGLTLAQVYSLKRQLISKYVSSDFYYVDTTGTTPVSGLLLRADQPTNNLLNIQTSDIACVQSNEQKILRDVGLFFKPDDIGLFKLNAVNSTFEIDNDNLESDKIYIFPDPQIYGNVGVNSLSSYPCLFTYDFRDNIRNISSGAAIGDPKITNKSLTFEPYSTKQRETQELTTLNKLGYRLNFSDLYNKGAIRKLAYDCFGNEYAMFKPEPMQDRVDVTAGLPLNTDAYDDVASENKTTLATNSSTDISTVDVGRITQTGTVFIKDQGTSLSLPISSVLANTLNKYSDSVVNDVNSQLVDFDVINDSIFIETPNSLLIDKLNYSSDGVFKKPNTSNTLFTTNSADPLNMFSNRLFVSDIETCNSNGSIFFVIFKAQQSSLPSNYWPIYPEIYQYNLNENNTIKIFPQTLSDPDLESFSTSVSSVSTNFAPVKIKTPKLAYSSMHNKLKLVYALMDQNNLSHLHDCLFEWKSGVLTLNKVTRYTPEELTLRTTTFGNTTTFADIATNPPNEFSRYDVSNNQLCIQ